MPELLSKKPYLTAKNRLARKVWAKEHALLPKIFWQNVLFLDGWGFIAHDGRKCLQKVCGTINSIKYLQIWQEILLQEMLLGEKLQQDNAPAHNSILSKTWFSENELEILENWPPNSPDINIIENVWNLLKKRVFQRLPQNIEELWAFCQKNSKEYLWSTFKIYIAQFQID